MAAPGRGPAPGGPDAAPGAPGAAAGGPGLLARRIASGSGALWRPAAPSRAVAAEAEAASRAGPGAAAAAGTQDGRLRISLFHTIYFADQYLVRPGGPLLDFLDGASLGGAGGQPQQEIQAQLNIAERGYGAELNADWKSATTVIGGVPGSTGVLNFSDILHVNARLFADLNQRKTLLEKRPALKGARISFRSPTSSISA